MRAPRAMDAMTTGADMASVETAVTPCPMVQPMAKTPPVPMRKPPAMCRYNSRASSQASQRMSSASQAHSAAPHTTPTIRPTP